MVCVFTVTYEPALAPFGHWLPQAAACTPADASGHPQLRTGAGVAVTFAPKRVALATTFCKSVVFVRRRML